MTTAIAILYAEHGPVEKVLFAHRHVLAAPGNSQVLLKTLVAPVNPADVLQVTGAYPARPDKTTVLGTDRPAAVAGNEGLFRVEAVGALVTAFTVGDWCIPRVPGLGTWRTHLLCEATAVIPLLLHLTQPEAATIGVNPLTAYQLLHQFLELKPGDWIIQNAGTSAVSKLVSQMARIKGVKTISVVRERLDMAATVEELMSLGATKVITDAQNLSEAFDTELQGWLGAGEVKLALNSVSGPSGTALARKLGPGGFVVTYGMMDPALPAISIPIQDYIFKRITSTGYWLTANIKADPQLKLDTLKEVSKYYERKELVAPSFESEEYIAGTDPSGEALVALVVRVIAAKGKQVLTFD